MDQHTIYVIRVANINFCVRTARKVLNDVIAGTKQYMQELSIRSGYRELMLH